MKAETQRKYGLIRMVAGAVIAAIEIVLNVLDPATNLRVWADLIPALVLVAIGVYNFDGSKTGGSR